jgi:hypothetical protein
MKPNPNDAGILAALMIRLQEYRLPRAKRILERVNRGEKLQDSDLQFLHRVFDDSRDIRPLVERNPDYLSLVTKMLDLYSEIISRSLENEKNQAGA